MKFRVRAFGSSVHEVEAESATYAAELFIGGGHCELRDFGEREDGVKFSEFKTGLGLVVIVEWRDQSAAEQVVLAAAERLFAPGVELGLDAMRRAVKAVEAILDKRLR